MPNIYGINPSPGDTPSPTLLQGSSNGAIARRMLAALVTNDLMVDSDRLKLIAALQGFINNGTSITATLGF